MKNDKNLQNIKKLAFGALFAALIFCGTYFIKLPMPFSEGYIHAGDGFVFLAAALLPAPYAMGAAAIGAGLSLSADIRSGYMPRWACAFLRCFCFRTAERSFAPAILRRSAERRR